MLSPGAYGCLSWLDEWMDGSMVLHTGAQQSLTPRALIVLPHCTFFHIYTIYKGIWHTFLLMMTNHSHQTKETRSRYGSCFLNGGFCQLEVHGVRNKLTKRQKVSVEQDKVWELCRSMVTIVDNNVVYLKVYWGGRQELIIEADKHVN